MPMTSVDSTDSFTMISLSENYVRVRAISTRVGKLCYLESSPEGLEAPAWIVDSRLSSRFDISSTRTVSIIDELFDILGPAAGKTETILLLISSAEMLENLVDN